MLTSSKKCVTIPTRFRTLDPKTRRSVAGPSKTNRAACLRNVVETKVASGKWMLNPVVANQVPGYVHQL